MTEYFVKVMCSEELPTESGYYQTDKGYCGFWVDIGNWYLTNAVEWWIKPIDLNYVKELAWDEGFSAGTKFENANFNYGFGTNEEPTNPYKNLTQNK
jgi:hypothetical protein